MTPSGFTIGMMTTSNVLNKKLLIVCFYVKYLTIPSAMKDPTVSQGCCLPKMSITSLFLADSFDILMDGMILLEIEYPTVLTESSLRLGESYISLGCCLMSSIN